MKILICGDSFSCDKNNTWVSFLKKDNDVKIVSNPGVSEYKILKQLENEKDHYNLYIVSHTSPYRIYMKTHPFYTKGTHQNSDLVLNDVFSRSIFNIKKLCINNFLRYHFDLEYYETVYSLMRSKINDLLTDKKYISLSNHPNLEKFVIEKNHLDMYDIWKNNPGNLNHYSEYGNRLVYKSIINLIQHRNIK